MCAAVGQSFLKFKAYDAWESWLSFVPIQVTVNMLSLRHGVICSGLSEVMNTECLCNLKPQPSVIHIGKSNIVIPGLYCIKIMDVNKSLVSGLLYIPASNHVQSLWV